MHPSHSTEPSRVVVYEYGQGWQESARASDELVPTSHARHDWPCSELNHPGSHETHSPPSTSVPGSQGEQRLPSSFEIEPSPHATHAEAPPVDAVPALHEVQTAALSFEKVPAEHVVHDASPTAALLPAAHSMHTNDPLMGEYVPAAQASHDAAPSDE